MPIVPILNDEGANGIDSNGGSGKSLIMKMIKHVRHTCAIDGKNFDISKDFAWSKVSLAHKVIAVDDLSSSFEFDKLFSVVTDGFTVNKKYMQPFEIPFKTAPKVIISANARIKGVDQSTMRRRYDVDINHYFSSTYRPMDEFGRRFFDDWNKGDWNDFFNLMIYCARFYLNNGLIMQDINWQKQQIFKSKHGKRLDRFAKMARTGLNLSNMVIEGGAKHTEDARNKMTEYAMAYGMKLVDISDNVIRLDDIAGRKQTKMTSEQIESLIW
jgi:hypothetical protein